MSSPASWLAKPTGSVTFREGEKVLTTHSAANTVYAWIRLDTVGRHHIDVEYSGDSNYLPSSASFNIESSRPVPAMVVSFTPAKPMAGQPVAMQVWVEAGTTGTVTWFGDQMVLGSSPIVDGYARLSVQLAWGSYTIRAHYDGDATWTGGDGQRLLVVYAGDWGAMNVRATAAGGVVTVRWSPQLLARDYDVWVRQTATSGWSLYFRTSTVSFSTTMGTGEMWAFAVSARRWSGEVSPRSAPDLANTIVYTDGPLSSGMPIRSVHVEELRAAVNRGRVLLDLPQFAFLDTSALHVRALHLEQLRLALAETTGVTGQLLSVTDPQITAGLTPVRAVHFQELRDALN